MGKNNIIHNVFISREYFELGEIRTRLKSLEQKFIQAGCPISYKEYNDYIILGVPTRFFRDWMYQGILIGCKTSWALNKV